LKLINIANLPFLAVDLPLMESKVYNMYLDIDTYTDTKIQYRYKNTKALINIVWSSNYIWKLYKGRGL